MEVGDQEEFEIVHVTSDGYGLAWGNNGEMVLIEGIMGGDSAVKVRIKKILEETIIAERIGRVRSESTPMKSKQRIDNPYGVDDEDEDEDDAEDDD
jgi:predicted RNA-binding protein with TRAM domain